MIGPAIGAACVVLAVAAVLMTMRASLLDVLTELCEGAQRAHFWWRVAAIELVAGTVLCTSVALLLVPRGASWRVAAAMVQGGAAGLLVSTAAVMVAVRIFERVRGS